MAKLFVFGIGGTGSRVIKSLAMLLASGVKPGSFDTIIPILIDPHKTLKELNDCKILIKQYSKINEILYENSNVISDGFFRTKMISLKAAAGDNSDLKDDLDFDEKHEEPFGDFINRSRIKNKSQTTYDLLSLLYSNTNFDQPLKVGFKGNPHMGSIVLNSIIDGPAYTAFKSSFTKDDKIFIISSIFGGTGASGFPVLLHNFRKSDNEALKISPIGVLSVMPYFKLTDAPSTSDIDSNDFLTKTKSALTYYTRLDFASLYEAMYYIADPYGQTTNNAYTNDEKNQDNKAHLVELLGAQAIIHFASNNNVPRGTVYEYCLNRDETRINFENIGNNTKKALGKNLTALHLLSKLHSYVKENSGHLSFCKTNDLDKDFFNDVFFTNNENGFEVFLNKFNIWISELDSNSRAFSPFDLTEIQSFNSLINGKNTYIEKHLFDGILTRPTDISDILTRVASKAGKKEISKLNASQKHCKYLMMCHQGLESFITSKLKIN